MKQLGRGLPQRGRSERGFTLIELLVSMVIGMVMVGALIAVYSNSSGASNAAQAQVQMAEDGQFALRTIAQQIRLAGYSPVAPNQITQSFAYPGNTTDFAVFGCGANFVSTTAANPTLLTCSTTGTSSHAISVSYEADIYNTTPNRTTPTVPTDCLGQALPAMPGTPTYYVAENRFYVANNQLMCAGSGNFANPQPLADNIESIQFSYGAINPNITDTKVIGGYLSAQGIGPSSGAGAPTNATMAALTTPGERWSRVIAVRVCVVVRSSSASFPEATGYLGCNPETNADVISITDGRLRKAFVSTVLLRNRMSLN
jgi:type IV pilus assembly protein PilW